MSAHADAAPPTHAAPHPTAARVRSRTFRGRTWAGVLLTVVVASNLMFAAIAAGLPPLVSMAVLLGATFATLGVVAGDAEVELTDDGIRERWTPLAARWLRLRSRERVVPLDAIRAFRWDHDLTRSMQRVEFLEIHAAPPHRRVLVTDRQDPGGFAAFRDAFLRIAARTNAEAPPDAAGDEAPPIRIRRGFYRSFAGRALTVVFAIAALLLVVAGLSGQLAERHLFQLGAVIVPGTLYMVWRAFVRRG